jgi:hypothetical protein
MTDTAVATHARHLRLVARDLRVNGDVQLVQFTDDGPIPYPNTLADVLWLIARDLDPEHCFEDGDPDVAS